MDEAKRKEILAGRLRRDNVGDFWTVSSRRQVMQRRAFLQVPILAAAAARYAGRCADCRNSKSPA